jgi:hypothetical protein
MFHGGIGPAHLPREMALDNRSRGIAKPLIGYLLKAAVMWPMTIAISSHKRTHGSSFLFHSILRLLAFFPALTSDGLRCSPIKHAQFLNFTGLLSTFEALVNSISIKQIA